MIAYLDYVMEISYVGYELNTDNRIRLKVEEKTQAKS